MTLVLACLGWASGPASAHAQAQRRDRARRVQARGDAWLRAGSPATAASYYRQAIQIDPRFASAYVQLGRAYLERGAVAEAVEVLHAGMRRAPDDPRLPHALAEALADRGDPKQAAEVLRKARRRHPESMLLAAAQARLARRRGAFTEALAAYRRILDADRGTTAVAEDAVEEAQRYVPALERLAGLDPVSRIACDDLRATAVRRALAGCVPPAATTE